MAEVFRGGAAIGTVKFGVPTPLAGSPTKVNVAQWNGSSPAIPVADNADFAGLSGTIAIRTAAEAMLWNMLSGIWERQRTPTVFNKSVQGITAAGVQNIWTPAAGKKFRLLAYRIDVPANVAMAAAADVQLNLTDGGAGLASTTVFVFIPAAAGAIAGLFSAWTVLPGNGFLSAAANNILGFNNGGAALTAGGYACSAIGTEE